LLRFSGLQPSHGDQPHDTQGKVVNEYKLTFTVTIKKQDDPAARKQAKDIVEAVSKVVSDADVKLQQVFTDQPPRGVRMD
jgi:hypothetical protein